MGSKRIDTNNISEKNQNQGKEIELVSDRESSVVSSDQLATESINYAIERAANLSSYSGKERSGVTQWAVGLDAGQSADNLVANIGARNLGATGFIPNTYIMEIPASGASTTEQLESLGAKFFYPLVQQQQQTRSVSNARFIPSDPLFKDQWHLVNNGQSGGTPGNDANIKTAWDSVTGKGVVIGIVDDGLKYRA